MPLQAGSGYPHAAALLEGVRQGIFKIQRCRACCHVPSFPRIACPSCFNELDWVDAAGRARVHSFTVIHRPHQELFARHVPIVMALIELEEGAKMISTIVGDDRLDTAIGSALVFAPDESWSALPQFQLVHDGRRARAE
jgi:uncharacterized OB-fold protein